MFSFGVQYYPEHWPRERWKTDINLMCKARIRIVRLGEFAWSRIEPEPERFNWEWLDEIIRLLGDAGIETMLGVPIEAPPRWLVKKYPDLPPVRRDGSRQPFGSRNHYCVNHPGMIDVSRRLTSAMAKRYAGNNNVTWWQIGNELFKHMECYCDYCLKAFQKWLDKKYNLIFTLNKSWGTVFWSQEYASFDEIVLPIERPNPGMILDFLRFRQDSVNRFHRMLAEVIVKVNLQARITHNIGGFAGPFDGYSFSRDLTASGVNNAAPRQAGEQEVNSQAAKFDLMRSFKNRPFWVLEQQVGICTKPEGLVPAHRPGLMRCWNYSALAHGARGLLHYQWRQCPFGDEQFHGSLLRYDGEKDSRYYHEAKQFGDEIQKIQDKISDEIPPAKVAVVMDYESWWANISYRWREPYPGIELVTQFHAWMRSNGLRCDFIPAQGLDNNLDGYPVVFIPHMLLLSRQQVDELERYVSKGGTLVVGPRFGIKDVNNKCYDVVRPGIASKLLGVEIRDWNIIPHEKFIECLWPKDRKRRRPARSFHGRVWADFLACKTASEAAIYKNQPGIECKTAVAINRFGSGKVWVLGTFPSAEDGHWIVRTILDDAGVKPDFPAPPPGVDFGLRLTNDNRRLWILTNPTDEAKTVQLPMPGHDLFKGHAIKGRVKIPPGNVLVFEEAGRGRQSDKKVNNHV